jgi:hypothetical protein
MLMFATSTSLAQTKEETIAWLQEKLDISAKHWDGNFQIEEISINECELEIRYTGIVYPYYDGYQTEKYMFTEYIPFEGLEINDVNYFSLVYYQGIKKVNTLHTYLDGTSAGLLSPNEFIYKSNIKISETEPNLNKLIMKAIKHLSTFCVEEEEPF